ncbi:FeoB-associated Cys-rich membrane protein [uncultured Flavobacterium sp.]|nr:FeoB-associated Cys-rich membrane protein [uncultured Flavobacterium sp.]
MYIQSIIAYVLVVVAAAYLVNKFFIKKKKKATNHCGTSGDCGCD